MLWSSFLQKQALIDSLQNSCSNKLFEKVPGRSASLLKKDSTLDVLLKSMQTFPEQLFFQYNNGRMLPKVQIAFF